ncbi:HAD family hydrolase [Nonomuraea lactucae]|uniref:HAD family hydrolase n=1 Tax=Nonomuraea lactucae TaxID=2249762 RepID=UPI000DE4C765|nr:HAD family hydrolase [Nonomuraea lactucae]
MSESVIVFDGDDTLWATEPLYEHALQQIAEYIDGQDIDGQAWIAAQRERDLENIKTFGLSRHRFPTSCIQAFIQVSTMAGRPISDNDKNLISTLAKQVFLTKASLLSGATEAVRRAAAAVPVVLLTAGDPWVQQRRIEDSGLGRYFTLICIVSKKSENEFCNVLAAMSAEADQSWSIGNSLPSDINPALRVGMNAAWVPANVWAYENREKRLASGRSVRVESIVDAVSTALSLMRPMSTVRRDT